MRPYLQYLWCDSCLRATSCGLRLKLELSRQHLLTQLLPRQHPASFASLPLSHSLYRSDVPVPLSWTPLSENLARIPSMLFILLAFTLVLVANEEIYDNVDYIEVSPPT